MRKNSFFVGIFSICLFVSIAFVSAGEQYPQWEDFSKKANINAAESYYWISPIIAPAGYPGDGPPRVLYSGDYIFNLILDGGQHSKRLLEELSQEAGFLNKGVMELCLEHYPKYCVWYSRIIIVGSKMLVNQYQKDSAEFKSAYLDIGNEPSILRRIHFPVEPSEENHWTGWPSNK